MKQNLKSVKATAWKWFSLYIRKKAAKEYEEKSDDFNICRCFTCGKFIDWKYDAEAGHFQSRRYESTMFDENNVHVQCNYCNHKLKGNIGVYYERIELHYGKWTASEIIKKSKMMCKRNYNDYKTISDKYRELYNSIK